MAFVNETIALLAVGVVATTLVIGTAVIKKDSAVPVESHENPKPLPVPIQVRPPVPAPPPPPPANVEAISKEIMEAAPSLSKEEVIDAVEKAERLDSIEQRIDEVVVEQRKLNDRIEIYITKQGPEK